MDKSFPSGGNTQERGAFLASLRILDEILTWLVGFFHLTEEEQRNAGIYLGDSRYK